MRGRKPQYESRAAEFRIRLSAWKQIPEVLRPSLRALARELGTTHQLLAYYLDGLEKWRARENNLAARREYERALVAEAAAMRVEVES